MYKNHHTLNILTKKKIFEINKIDILLFQLQQNFIINILRDVFY